MHCMYMQMRVLVLLNLVALTIDTDSLNPWINGAKIIPSCSRRIYVFVAWFFPAYGQQKLTLLEFCHSQFDAPNSWAEWVTAYVTGLWAYPCPMSWQASRQSRSRTTAFRSLQWKYVDCTSQWGSAWIYFLLGRKNYIISVCSMIQKSPCK